MKLKFKGSCLKQEAQTVFIPKNVVNYLLYLNYIHGHEIYTLILL